jgi:hypothetical protein
MRTPGEFATALFGERLPEGTYVATWALRGKRSGWWRSAQALDSLARREDCFVGVALAARDYGAHRRLPAADAVGIGGLWLDIDVVGGPEARDHGAPSKDEALAVGSAVLPPTLVIDSGWGIHTWHLLPQTWRFRSRLEQHEASDLAARWYRLHAQNALRAGWHLDQSTRDLARIMRLPGTVNAKGGERRPVRLVGTGPRHELDALRLALHDVTTTRHDGPAGDLQPLGEFRVRRGAQPPADKLHAMLVNSPEFANAWYGARPDFGDDKSRYDLSLADLAVLAGWPDQDIAVLIGARRGWDDKAMRPDYIARTLHAARKHPDRYTDCGLCHTGAKAA